MLVLSSGDLFEREQCVVLCFWHNIARLYFIFFALLLRSCTDGSDPQWTIGFGVLIYLYHMRRRDRSRLSVRQGIRYLVSFHRYRAYHLWRLSIGTAHQLAWCFAPFLHLSVRSFSRRHRLHCASLHVDSLYVRSHLKAE